MDEEVMNFWLTEATLKLNAIAAFEELPRQLAMLRFFRYRQDLSQYM